MRVPEVDEERSSTQALDRVPEETEEVERKQRRADTSAKVAGVIVVLYGLYGFSNGVRLWVDKVTWLAAFGPPHTERSLSGLLSEVAWSVVIWVIMGFLFVLIAKSLLDSAQRKLRRLDVKRAGSAVPLTLLVLSGIIAALSGVQSWVASSMSMSRLLGETPSLDLPGLVLEIVDSVALFVPIMFVAAMVVWWVVVALWSRFSARSRQT